MNYHNYEIVDGDLYFAAGDNAHDSGLGTFGEPKATPYFENNLKHVFGTGVYDVSNISGRYKNVIADGHVIFRVSLVSVIEGSFNDITFEAQPGFSLTGSPFLIGQFNSCQIVGGDWSSLNMQLYDCIVRDAMIGERTTSQSVRTIGINTSLLAYGLCKDNYYDFDSFITLNPDPTTFGHNNMQAILLLGGNRYAIQDELVGTPQDNGYPADVKWLNEAQLTADGYTGQIAGWDASVATCMNKDPEFTDIALQAFTLKSSSPMIGKSSTGANITGQPVGSLLTLNSANGLTVFIIASPEIDITNPLALVLKPGETRGTIRYIWKFPGNQPVAFEGIVGYKGMLQFDVAYTGGSAQNQNVPSYSPVTNPTIKTSSVTGPDTVTIPCNNHGLSVGQIFRYDGQDAAISEIVDINSFKIDTALRAPIPALEFFEVGDADTMSALRNNLLDYRWRTSVEWNFPDTPSKWDNDVLPSYGIAGQYLLQRLFDTPKKYYDGMNVYGGADPNRPVGVAGETYMAQWAEAELTLVDTYKG